MSKKNTFYAASGLLLVLALLLPACEFFKKKETAAEGAKQEVVQEPKLRVLDFNTEEVRTDARIPGSTQISVEKLDEASKNWDKKTPIVTYCSGYDCAASHQAAQKLVDLGFEDVSVFAGGMNEWVRMSKTNKDAFPVEGEAKLAYLEKEVAKVEPKEGVRYKTVSAEELSKRLAESKA